MGHVEGLLELDYFFFLEMKAEELLKFSLWYKKVFASAYQKILQKICNKFLLV